MPAADTPVEHLAQVQNQPTEHAAMSGSPSTTRTSGSPPPPQHLGRWLVLAVIAAAVVVGGIAAFRVDSSGRGGSGLSERFELQTEDYASVPPELLGFRETGGWETAVDQPRAIATGPDQRVYVAGDRCIAVFQAEQPVAAWSLAGEPSCVAAGSDLHVQPGRVYVGVADRILVFQPDGTAAGIWSEGLDEKSVLTSIAVGEQAVFVADAGNRIVLHYDADGGLQGVIGRPYAERGVRGFVLPSLYFDVALSPEGLVWIANPGARRIESYTPDGIFQTAWGTASADIEGFFGCCNPANFAIFPDGRFVTCEKGIPRVKIYDLQGAFQTVVADPEILGQQPNITEEIREQHQAKVFDVAVDDRGRVMVLDPSQRRVRCFEPLPQAE